MVTKTGCVIIRTFRSEGKCALPQAAAALWLTGNTRNVGTG